MRTHVRTQAEQVVDTLSILMQILGIIINGAKIVGVLILFAILLAVLKYFALRFKGFLPTVAMTAFVLSILSANIEQVYGVAAILWLRLSSIIYSFSDSVTFIILLFAILLCCAIATRLEVLSHSTFKLFKIKRNKQEASVDACNMSNSYLATTPVLLS